VDVAGRRARGVAAWFSAAHEPGGPGHVLITSRNPGWGELAAPVDVDVLPRPDSAALLRTYRPSLDEADADQLTAALGDLPLALAQAGGFLAETGMPASRYLGLLATHAQELLDQGAPDTRGDGARQAMTATSQSRLPTTSP
jgi:hypothetical protein